MNKIMSEAKPTASIAINKSRLKMYDRKSKTPTYYLKKNQEFEIELFNPTKDNVLAVITLNGKHISQGGLVLRPGERVFLDRYLDVAKKFKFDVYEVNNTKEVKKAIEENGDFKVEFYREQIQIPIFTRTYPTYQTYTTEWYDGTTYLANSSSNTSISLDTLTSNTNAVNFYGNLDGINKPKKRGSLETGRVEMGSNSNQKMETVNKSWDYLPFHTIEYKLLPISVKVNTSNDINIKRYCTSCGSKLRKGDNFCGKCGNKA